jgi:hypothetical protein
LLFQNHFGFPSCLLHFAVLACNVTQGPRWFGNRAKLPQRALTLRYCIRAGSASNKGMLGCERHGVSVHRMVRHVKNLWLTREQRRRLGGRCGGAQKDQYE